MQAAEFDELAFFAAIERSGVRALLIGRRALVVLGLPVLTADYDYWIDIDHVERFNEAAHGCELAPTHPPEMARRRGRYALENDEHVDVLVARVITTFDGTDVRFDDVWQRRQTLPLQADVGVNLPSIDDLILTKRFASRAKDLEDIRLLEILKQSGR
jgi:hypothetical protein